MRTKGREPELLQPIKLRVKKIKDLDFFFLSRDYEKKRFHLKIQILNFSRKLKTLTTLV